METQVSHDGVVVTIGISGTPAELRGFWGSLGQALEAAEALAEAPVHEPEQGGF